MTAEEWKNLTYEEKLLKRDEYRAQQKAREASMVHAICCFYPTCRGYCDECDQWVYASEKDVQDYPDQCFLIDPADCRHPY